jgi:hypothetical protein
VLLAICGLIFYDTLVDQMLWSVDFCTVAGVSFGCFAALFVIILEGLLIVDQCNHIYALSCISVELLVKYQILEGLVDYGK